MVEEEVNVDLDVAKEERTGVETLELSGAGCVIDVLVEALN